MGGARRKVLVVEDDPDTRELLAELLTRQFEVATAADAEEALAIFTRDRPDAVVTDETLPGQSGSELALEVKRLAPSCFVVLVSGYARETLDCGASDLVLEKPIRVEHLIAVLTSEHKAEHPHASVDG
jgi:DNA-binding NtrC family response regulator